MLLCPALRVGQGVTKCPVMVSGIEQYTLQSSECQERYISPPQGDSVINKHLNEYPMLVRLSEGVAQSARSHKEKI